jgi:hypothetical protein
MASVVPMVGMLGAGPTASPATRGLSLAEYASHLPSSVVQPPW